MVVESLLFCLREGAPPREGLSYIDFLSTSGIPFSAFGTALLQGPTRFGLSHFRFHTAAGIHPPPSARPFSKGLLASDYLSFAFAPLRGSILRLWRAPSLRGHPLRDYLTFAFIPLRRIGFKQSQTFLDDVFYVLPHIFEVVLDVEV